MREEATCLCDHRFSSTVARQPYRDEAFRYRLEIVGGEKAGGDLLFLAFLEGVVPFLDGAAGLIAEFAGCNEAGFRP